MLLILGLCILAVFKQNAYCDIPAELGIAEAYMVQVDEMSGSAVNASTVRRLLNTTLADYDVRIRPRLNQTKPVVVNVTFTPISILALDTTEQRLDITGFFTFSWNDELLTWSPSLFDGVYTIKLPVYQVWRPRAVILKAFHTSNIIGNMKMDTAQVKNKDGDAFSTVTWVPEGIYSVLCELDVTFYPFDIQDCHLQFYVADETYHSVFLEGASDISLASYSENSEWKLLRVRTNTLVKYSTNIINVSFRLERRAEFSLYTIMLPLLFLSILDVFGFLIPVESGEKISYMVTLFLTFGIFVFILRDGLPHNSLIISHFLVYIMQLSLVSVVSVIYSIAQTNLNKSHGNKEFRLLGNKVGVDPSPESFVKVKANDNNRKNNTFPSARSSPSAKRCPGDRRNHDIEKGKRVAITWSEALRKMDILMFVLFTVLVFLFTTVFFAVVLNR